MERQLNTAIKHRLEIMSRFAELLQVAHYRFRKIIRVNTGNDGLWCFKSDSRYRISFNRYFVSLCYKSLGLTPAIRFGVVKFGVHYLSQNVSVGRIDRSKLQ